MNPSTKGERTRAAILDAGFRIVSQAGLEGLTIGTLAEATGMSKSGLFAHFGSREELLLAVLAHGQAQFGEVVFQPALAKPRGLPRVRAMFVNWLDWTESAELPGGCPMRSVRTRRCVKYDWPVFLLCMRTRRMYMRARA